MNCLADWQVPELKNKYLENVVASTSATIVVFTPHVLGALSDSIKKIYYNSRSIL